MLGKLNEAAHPRSIETVLKCIPFEANRTLLSYLFLAPPCGIVHHEALSGFIQRLHPAVSRSTTSSVLLLDALVSSRVDKEYLSSFYSTYLNGLSEFRRCEKHSVQHETKNKIEI